MDKAEDLQLNGLKVLVTRPEEQATPLLEAIASHGGVAKSFPLLEIMQVDTIPSALAQLEQYQLIIFVSRNAVIHSWALLDANRKPSLPDQLKVAAMGRGTADELSARGQRIDHLPSTSFDSEGLLALAAMQSVQGQRILIVRGQSGREHMATVLRQRGAKVDYVEVYQRLKTKRVLTNQDSDVDAIVLSSSEAIQHLADCARRDQQAWVFAKQIVAIHPRIAMQAGDLGFTLKPVIAEQEHDSGLEFSILNALKSIA